MGEQFWYMLGAIGDRRSKVEDIMSGDIVVAALVGVVPCDASVPGDMVSEGDTTPLPSPCDSPSLCGEYGGGGDATGSTSSGMSNCV